MGVLCTLWIVRLRCLPPGVSPALFQALVDGPATLDDPEWLEALFPKLASLVRPWPHTYEPDNNPFHNKNHPDHSGIIAIIEGCMDLKVSITCKY